jgi:hypothetical protein
MSELYAPVTQRLAPGDLGSDFRCGNHALDDYLARHALANEQIGIGRTFVLRRLESDPPDLPAVLGYYTLSMSLLSSTLVQMVIGNKLPKYPMPVGLIGKLASDERTRGRGLRVGETLLMDAFSRILQLSPSIGCVGVVVDAVDAGAQDFYLKYGFVVVEPDAAWPRKMFVPLDTIGGLFAFGIA